MFTNQPARCGEVTLQASVGPDHGPPLVFLHGVGRRGADFNGILGPLSLNWQPHLLDLRGHGGSDRTPDHYRVRDYAEDVAEYLDALPEHEPAVLIGHSLGAVTAAAVAARRPDRVHAIVLEDPPGPGFLAHLERTPYLTQFTGARELARRGGDRPRTGRGPGGAAAPQARRHHRPAG
jgi:pimeloyl-ACP methyl ester carboxylesterase